MSGENPFVVADAVPNTGPRGNEIGNRWHNVIASTGPNMARHVAWMYSSSVATRVGIGYYDARDGTLILTEWWEACQAWNIYVQVKTDG